MGVGEGIIMFLLQNSKIFSTLHKYHNRSSCKQQGKIAVLHLNIFDKFPHMGENGTNKVLLLFGCKITTFTICYIFFLLLLLFCFLSLSLNFTQENQESFSQC